MSFLRHKAQRMSKAQHVKHAMPFILRGLSLSLNGCPPAEPLSVLNQATQTNLLNLIFTNCLKNGKSTALADVFDDFQACKTAYVFDHDIQTEVQKLQVLLHFT